MIDGLHKQFLTNVIYSRYAQLIINERIKSGHFKIPVHLALGHEIISEALCTAMRTTDQLLCTHRNIHYQLGRGAKLSEILAEFKLSKDGLAKGLGGSMNLSNPKGSIVYTSSILGNNLCVGLGFALTKKIKKEDGVIFIVTGDGAMEEGAFYETIENARNMDLPIVILVENNNWSLASQINERRKPIDLHELANSLGANYSLLSSNNIIDYYEKINTIREKVNSLKLIEIIEVQLTTLGGWIIQHDDFPNGKYVNYHAGKAPKVTLDNGPILLYDANDPLFLMRENFGEDNFTIIDTIVRSKLNGYMNI